MADLQVIPPNPPPEYVLRLSETEAIDLAIALGYARTYDVIKPYDIYKLLERAVWPLPEYQEKLVAVREVVISQPR